MNDKLWLKQQAALTLDRLLPRVEVVLTPADATQPFYKRLHEEFPRLFRLLYDLYGTHYDFFYHLEQILLAAARMYQERPADLQALDRQRVANPYWFQQENMMGGVCYVDLFAGDLQGVRAKIPYFQEMGLTYLHLMPLFLAPEENSDGGYAVSSYRAVNPSLGTMQDLRALAADLRAVGISLVVDFVFNHTSDEHEWAQRALAGEEPYRSYYWLFPDRAMPDRYEQHLREIFPEQDPGSFTHLPDHDLWAWTTFRRFQWDLNYSNPAVFRAMLEEMLFLANQGVEVLRLDAVAFIWKQLGTGCESLPQAHLIIQAYNALARIVAPALVFKSEAIVHPDYVVQYINRDECPLSYNPTLMNLLWEALATREVRLLKHSMVKRFALPDDCTWVNYVRCHDDIGWSFANEDAAELGINGFDHRQFLNRFYTGQFEGSFAQGLPFNYNPETQDMRISGMTASLAGLEQALTLDHAQDSVLFVDHALRRILLIHSIILSIGGIPLLYLGDELAMVNDYRYRDDEAKANDSRWVHRPPFDWARVEQAQSLETVAGRVWQGLRHLIKLRQQLPVLANGHTSFLETGNPHVLGYSRHDQLLVLANFAEHEQIVEGSITLCIGARSADGQDLISQQKIMIGERLTLAPYQVMWVLVEKAY